MQQNQKTSIERLLSEYLEGLILPDEGLAVQPLLWLIIALGLFLILFGFWKWLQFRSKPKQLALQKLKKLAKDSLRQKSRTSAIQLAAILRSGLNIKRLSLFTANDSQHKSKWQSFTKQLNTACYAEADIDQNALQDLIKQSRSWLASS